MSSSSEESSSSDNEIDELARFVFEKRKAASKTVKFESDRENSKKHVFPRTKKQNDDSENQDGAVYVIDRTDSTKTLTYDTERQSHNARQKKESASQSHKNPRKDRFDLFFYL